MVDPVSAAIGIGGSLLSGILGGGAARRAKRKAQQEARRLKRKLDFLESNRPVSYTHLTLPTKA